MNRYDKAIDQLNRIEECLRKESTVRVPIVLSLIDIMRGLITELKEERTKK